MTLTEAKATLRKEVFARRKAVHGTGLDAPAQDHLARALEPYEGKVLAGYMPIRTEIDPVPVMDGWLGLVGVPVIRGAGEPLDFHRWFTGCAMVDGPFGARVPEVAEVVVPEALIVPLVAFDGAGARLGYGGGFYDRTLELLRAQGPVTAIGFAYAAQEVAKVPREPTDQLLDAVVTEHGLRRFADA